MSKSPSLVALDNSIVKPHVENPRGLHWRELKQPELEGGEALADNRLKSKNYAALQEQLKQEQGAIPTINPYNKQGQQ
jgi:hypothetical protein